MKDQDFTWRWSVVRERCVGEENVYNPQHKYYISGYFSIYKLNMGVVFLCIFMGLECVVVLVGAGMGGSTWPPFRGTLVEP